MTIDFLVYKKDKKNTSITHLFLLEAFIYLIFKITFIQVQNTQCKHFFSRNLITDVITSLIHHIIQLISHCVNFI